MTANLDYTVADATIEFDEDRLDAIGRKILEDWGYQLTDQRTSSRTTSKLGSFHGCKTKTISVVSIYVVTFGYSRRNEKYDLWDINVVYYPES